MSGEKKPVHSGHRARMRRRLAETGLEGFQPHEILEMLLYCAIPKRDVNPLAHALLNEFGSVDAVLSASPEELCRIDGMGRQTCEFFAALNALEDGYHAGCHASPNSIRSLADAVRMIPPSLRNARKASLSVLYTDRFNRPLSLCDYPGRPNDPTVIRSVLAKSLSLNSHNTIIFYTGFRSVHPHEMPNTAMFRPLISALSDIDSFTVDCVLLSPTHLMSLRGENQLTSAATEFQDFLSGWKQWLGPLAQSESQDFWHPIELLESACAPFGRTTPPPP